MNASGLLKKTMPYILDRQMADAVDRASPSRGQDEHVLVADVGRDLASLRVALPQLCRRLLEEPRNYVRLLAKPAHSWEDSLLSCLQALERLWIAARSNAIGVPIALGARKFVSRLLDVCDQALEWSGLALKHGYFDQGGPGIRRDIDALAHILQVTGIVALWHVRWSLLDGSHSRARSASTLLVLLETLANCPDEACLNPCLDEARHRLVLACMLCLAQLEDLPAENTYRVSALLDELPRELVLQCFDPGLAPPGPYIVFALNDIHLAQVDAASAAPRLGICFAPVQEHLGRLHLSGSANAVGGGLGALGALLRQLGTVDKVKCGVGGERQLARASLGVSNIVRNRQECLEFLPWPGVPQGGDRIKAGFGSLRVSRRLLLRQCSGSVITVQPTPEAQVSLCLIASVEADAGRSKRLHLQLLSDAWFIDRVQPLDMSGEKSGLFGGQVILARGARCDDGELLMVVEMDLREPRPSAMPSWYRLQSSGAVYERVGAPRHLWGAVCMKIVPSHPVAGACAPAVSVQPPSLIAQP